MKIYELQYAWVDSVRWLDRLAESTRCEIKGSSSHVRQRFFEASKSVIYNIIRL